MTFEIKHADSKREDFGEYRYNIYQSGRLVARYWHDYRGDDHGIEFLNGTTEEWPVGRMVEFVTGGGPEPLGLSDRAVAYITKKLDHEFPA
jgi:hypothetical protein